MRGRRGEGLTAPLYGEMGWDGRKMKASNETCEKESVS